MSRVWIILLLALAGCSTPTPPSFPRCFQITVPEARGSDVIIMSSADEFPGFANSYNIQFYVLTNAQPAITNMSPYYADMYWYITTNLWPYVRNHIDLSLDGGQTWARRIGYGVKCNVGRHGGEFDWSPPLRDWSLLTTNAVLRITDLDGHYMYRGSDFPFEWPTNSYCVSFPFRICGGHITQPVQGQIAWQGEIVDVTWNAVGLGPVADVYWVTPESGGRDMQHWITTVSNITDGVYTKTISLNVPTNDSLELVIVSQANPMIRCFSAPFTVDP